MRGGRDHAFIEWLCIAGGLAACTRVDPSNEPDPPRSALPLPGVSAVLQPDAALPPPPDSRPLHLDTQEDLLELFKVRPGKHRVGEPDAFLKKFVGPGGPAFFNQGNPEIARHAISRQACQEGLARLTLQTEAQQEVCGGRENMVPIYTKGKIDRTKTCIDIFEYPNRACELPIVWVPPVHAAMLCDLQGKRLCTQEEWVLACAGDPLGEAASRHAYGGELDLSICNTQKSAKESACDATSARSAWKSCATHTEPSGAFPGCRSRFGVFDMHGNVAEAMTRLDADGHVYSQLKGSAFFYVDVVRKPGDAAKRENYPDHCAHDPRWHVERMTEAWHVNYHLGFRCCMTAGKEKEKKR
jgi:hypothetical protein